MRRRDYDWIVVGSGFGGSVAALRLAERGDRVAVLEAGRRFADDEFAESTADLRNYLWAPAIGLRGIMRVTLFRHVLVLTGAGVGGGSLVYANTLYRPRGDAFYRAPQWAAMADWRAALGLHFDEAERMLGVVSYDREGPGERLLRQVGDDLGVGDTFRTTPVGIYFGEPGVTASDPYFGGDGPPRTGCAFCGRCMVGCRLGSKNTTDKNYLHLAERRGGAQVEPERTVVDVRPLDGGSGATGYAVTSVRSGAWARRDKRTVTARGVVLAAGALGTNVLLRRCRTRGSLPRLSDRLGQLVRTNSEAITAATRPDDAEDYSHTIAVSASIFPDEHTHVTTNTYGHAGDSMSLNFGPLSGDGGRLSRPARFVAGALRDPRGFARTMSTDGWSRRTIVFTTMQDHDVAMRLRPMRGPLGALGVLQTEEDPERPARAFIPAANRVAEAAALRMGGFAQSSLAEALLNVPTTAHFLGGAVIGPSPEHGVVDGEQRVYGYDNLLICDGSVIPANVGVNPSLTITALAEHALSRL